MQIDELICVQRVIRIDYAEQIAENARESLLRLAFPVRNQSSENRFTNLGSGHFFLLSRQMDYRVLAIRPLKIEETLSINGLPQLQDALIVAFGSGSPFITVIEYRGKYILINGYHRVYGMRKAGIITVPCLVFHATTPEQVTAVAASHLASRIDALIQSPYQKFSDFFDENVAETIQTKPKLNAKKIEIKIEGMSLEMAGIA